MRPFDGAHLCAREQQLARELALCARHWHVDEHLQEQDNGWGVGRERGRRAPVLFIQCQPDPRDVMHSMHA